MFVHNPSATEALVDIISQAYRSQTGVLIQRLDGVVDELEDLLAKGADPQELVDLGRYEKIPAVWAILPSARGTDAFKRAGGLLNEGDGPREWRLTHQMMGVFRDFFAEHNKDVFDNAIVHAVLAVRDAGVDLNEARDGVPRAKQHLSLLHHLSWTAPQNDCYDHVIERLLAAGMPVCRDLENDSKYLASKHPKTMAHVQRVILETALEAVVGHTPGARPRVM